MRKSLDLAGKLLPSMSDKAVHEAYAKFQDERQYALDNAKEVAAKEMRERNEQRMKLELEKAAKARARQLEIYRRQLRDAREPFENIPDDQIEAVHAAWINRIREEQSARAVSNEISRLFAASACPQRHIENLGKIDQNPKWLAVRDKLVCEYPRGYLVSLLGIRGNGKTQLAVSVIRKVCEMQGSAKYVKALDLFREIRATFRQDATISEEDLLDRYAAYDLLVVDEAHQRGNTDFEQNTLINLLDRRYDASLATILIANQSKDESAKALGDSVVSRTHETGAAIICDWPSYRKPGAWEAK